MSGTINHNGDIDTFRIQIDAATNVIIFTTGNLNTSGRVISPTGNPLIVFNAAGDTASVVSDTNNSGDGNNFLLNIALSPGSQPYYIGVAAVGVGTTGTYTLHVNEDDHANSTETATILTSLGQTGQINTGDDVDYFRIQPGFAVTLNIFTTGSLNTIGTLLDSSGNFLDVNDDLGNALNFIITTHLAAGTYYLAVESFANLTGSYTLRAEQRSDFTDDHGDTIAMTTDIELNTSESGTINVNFEPDYFKLVLNNPTDVSIFTTETDGRNMVGTLIDNVGNVLGTYGTSGGNFLINRFLTSGTYYIRVSISDTSDALRIGDYVLNVYDNVLQPIGLEVKGPTELNLVRFTSTMIGVTVDVAADLTVKAEGAVSLEGTQSEYSLTGGAEATQIPIEAVSIGDGTVTFTVSGERKETATEVVTVTVSKPTLMISASTSELTIEADQTTAELTVTVMAVGGHNSTLTATVTGIRNVASVTPTRIVNLIDNTPEIFIVEGLATATGITMLTLMASHPDYISADTTITVNVIRPVDALRFRVKVFLEGAQ